MEKRNKVTQAVLQITMEDGLAGLSFDKLAKRAGVSSGTPYVYYRDKTDFRVFMRRCGRRCRRDFRR